LPSDQTRYEVTGWFRWDADQGPEIFYDFKILDMETTTVKREPGHADWNYLVFGTLRHAFITSSHDLLWAIDRDKRVIMANEPFKRFVSEMTGTEIRIDDPIVPVINKSATANKWEVLYARALDGEKFSVITSYMTTYEPVLIDATFIPLTEGGKVMGAACIARNIKNYNGHSDDTYELLRA
jgi:hypothetical protein